MSRKLKLFLIKKYFKRISPKEQTKGDTEILFSILHRNTNCKYGNQYNFAKIKSYKDFTQNVPLSNYEMIYPYIKRILSGEKKILTKDKVIYFAKTSGTTSGDGKYLPITKKCLSENHFKVGKLLFNRYLHNNPDSMILEGKNLSLGGGFFPNTFGGKTKIGYISAILQKESGILGKIFQAPSQKISFLNKRETKIPKIIKSTKNKNITLSSGVPSWGAILFQEYLKKTKSNTMLDIRPNFELFLSGGMNFEPYRKAFKKLFPSKKINFYQVYNASEGFFGFQYTNNSIDMKLITKSGVFYEFIEMNSFYSKTPKVIDIQNIKQDINYALVITTYSGLYRYIIGDIIRFSNIDKKLFNIVGRTKLTLDSFAEHLISDNIEQALAKVTEETNSEISNYHVAPFFFNDFSGKHEWIIEFKNEPNNLNLFINKLDLYLKKYNGYYAGKREKDLLIKPPSIYSVPKGTFLKRMEKKGKLGGQNKFPQISNDRKILEELLNIAKKKI